MLTKRQSEILDFIIDYHVSNNHPASYRTISGHFGFQASAAYCHVSALEKKGYVERMDGYIIARGIRTWKDSISKS